MRIAADRDRCEGHGVCADVAPEVYDLDDDAVVVARYDTGPPGWERTAAAGARASPRPSPPSTSGRPSGSTTGRDRSTS